jgi:hypothetical protein
MKMCEVRGKRRRRGREKRRGDIQPDYLPNSGVFHVSAVYVGGIREAA